MKNELTEARKAVKESGVGLALVLLASSSIALVAGVVAAGVYVAVLAAIAACAVGALLHRLCIAVFRR